MKNNIEIIKEMIFSFSKEKGIGISIKANKENITIKLKQEIDPVLSSKAHAKRKKEIGNNVEELIWILNLLKCETDNIENLNFIYEKNHIFLTIKCNLKPMIPQEIPWGPEPYPNIFDKYQEYEKYKISISDNTGNSPDSYYREVEYIPERKIEIIN